MRLFLTKSYNTVLTIIIVPLMLFKFPFCLLLLVRRLHGEFVCLLFLQAHRGTDPFLAVSGVQLAQTNFRTDYNNRPSNSKRVQKDSSVFNRCLSSSWK